jgi:ketosteroid isomerase-like protein
MKTSKIALTAFAGFAAVVAAGCSKPAASVDTGQVAATIKGEVGQLVTAFNAHDVQKSVAQDAPGMVGMFHGTPNIVGPAADLAQTQQQLADPSAKIAVADETVDVASSGDLAVYRATYAYDYADPKTRTPMVESGNWVIGYKQQSDGTWQVIWNVVSDTGPAKPAPAAG